MQQYDLLALRSFITVVDTGSFNQAAQLLESSTAAISRRVSGLEASLGVRLLNRTTRKIDLTESGKQFYDDVINIFQSLEEAEERIQQGRTTIRGSLRVAAGISFGTTCISPLLPKFMQQHPELEVQLKLDDSATDLVAESIDVALRIGELKDSTLIASKISSVQRYFCASPAYIAKYGEPKHPSELINHNCLRYNAANSRHGFDFEQDNITQHIEVTGSLTSNNGEVLKDATINDIGISQLPDFIIADAVAQGSLKIILQEYSPPPFGLYAIRLSRKFTPAKVNALINYLKAEFEENPCLKKPLAC